MAVNTNFDELVELVTDLTSAEKLTLNNAVYQKFFEVGDVVAGHNVITGIRDGNLIPIVSNAPNYASFPFKDLTNCTLPTCDVDLNFSPKKWELGANACRISICYNAFDENFLLFWGQYKRVFADASLDTGLLAYVQEVVNRNLRAAMWRQAYFGDKTISGGEENYALLRSMNGIFTQAEAMDGYKIEIDENATRDLTGEEAYAYLKDAYNYASTQPWFDASNLVFEMTSAMANVLVAWLNGLGDTSMYNCTCYDPNGITSSRVFGIDNLMIFGIPVKVYREFDGVINQLNLGRPYRAILTTRDNILFGTSETDQLPDFRIWYSQDDNTIYIDAGFSMAPALVVDDYVYIGAENGSTPST